MSFVTTTKSVIAMEVNPVTGESFIVAYGKSVSTDGKSVNTGGKHWVCSVNCVRYIQK